MQTALSRQTTHIFVAGDPSGFDFGLDTGVFFGVDAPVFFASFFAAGGDAIVLGRLDIPLDPSTVRCKVGVPLVGFGAATPDLVGEVNKRSTERSVCGVPPGVVR